MHTKLKSPISRKQSDTSLDEQVPEVVIPTPLRVWPEANFEVTRQLQSGAILGAFAACTSLLLNIIGSVLWPAISGVEQHPLRFIQVYLTFPMGEAALRLNSGLVLALGCVLYLCTGIFYGILFEILISYFLPYARIVERLVVCSAMALFLWAFNFYAVLIWLQPMLCGGSWIVELVPWWVALLTHLVFGWTMALIVPDTSHAITRRWV